MNVSHHLRNVNHWMVIENEFYLPSKLIYLWMAIKKIWLLVIEFGKGACYMSLTLALGSQPRQRLVKVRAKSETRESHFMLQKCRRM